MELIATVALFGACMAGLGIGVILRGRSVQRSCGTDPSVAGDPSDHDVSCGACVRQDAEVCPTDEPLVRLAQIAHPDPRHHR